MEPHPQSLRELAKQANTIADDIDALLVEADARLAEPKGLSPDEARALEVETYRIQARLRGHLQEAHT